MQVVKKGKECMGRKPKTRPRASRNLRRLYERPSQKWEQRQITSQYQPHASGLKITTDTAERASHETDGTGG